MTRQGEIENVDLQPIDPPRARQLLEDRQAVLIDIREPDEFARERIAGARSQPLSSIGNNPVAIKGISAVIFCCKAGSRTAANATKLAQLAECQAYVLEGGLDAWKRAQLPIVSDRAQPIEILRQVQIVSGALVVLGIALGAAIRPAFYLLAALIGAGLVLAGISGNCAMATLLKRMPWNRGN